MMNDEYKFTLSEKYLKIAKEELREDDARRSQALKQFREWIEKHPNFKKCRTDSIFLLKFLRTKKFSVPLACEMLENYLEAHQMFDKWFVNLDPLEPKMMKLIENGYILPMRDRDEFGRKIIMAKLSRLDWDVHTGDDIFRFNNLVSAYFINEEESQIAGYVLIADYTNTSLKLLSIIPLMDLRNWLTYIPKVATMRMKEIHFVNLPSFANTLAEFSLNFLSKKLKDRVHFHNSYKSLCEYVDPKLLPKEHGGKYSESELVKELKDTLLEHRGEILEYSQSFLITKNCNNSNDNYNDMNAGSFRKLDID